MIAVLVAVAAFFAPPAVGLLAPRTRMPGVWLTTAMCTVPVCAFFNQPLAAVAAVLSMLLTAIAVGSCRPYPRLSWRQRWTMRVFRRELKPLGKCDLADAAASDPHPGDERVA
jgi:hypothetical protein